MRTAAFAAGVVVLGAACGRAAPVPAGAAAPEPAPGGGTSGTPAAPAATPGAQRGSGAPAGVGSTGAAPATSPPAGAPSETGRTPPSRAVPSDLPDGAPLTVRVAADCVVPGGTQRLVVDTLPDAYVAYDNLYADSRDGAVHGGIDGQARSDARGHFEAEWVVARTAPLGDVRLDVGASAQGRGSVRMVFYRLASSCP